MIIQFVDLVSKNYYQAFGFIFFGSWEKVQGVQQGEIILSKLIQKFKSVKVKCKMKLTVSKSKDLTVKAAGVFRQDANETEEKQPNDTVRAQTWWDIVGQVQHGPQATREKKW